MRPALEVEKAEVRAPTGQLVQPGRRQVANAGEDNNSGRCEVHGPHTGGKKVRKYDITAQGRQLLRTGRIGCCWLVLSCRTCTRIPCEAPSGVGGARQASKAVDQTDARRASSDRKRHAGRKTSQRAAGGVSV